MVGVDLVQISRIEKFYEKFGQKAWQRFLNDDEIALVQNSPQRAAGFWAAKEAISKALGCGISQTCSFYDIWIHKDKLGKPYFTLTKSLIDTFEITSTALSIAHDGKFAIAVAIIESKKEQKHLFH